MHNTPSNQANHERQVSPISDAVSMRADGYIPEATSYFLRLVPEFAALTTQPTESQSASVVQETVSEHLSNDSATDAARDAVNAALAA